MAEKAMFLIWETTPFYPRSPYAAAKLYAYWVTVNYREAYNLFATNGILFNHESPIRGETFVTRKITRSAARIALGMEDRLYLGNLNALRDWGHAGDFVRAMWMILQHHEPDDFVIATGEQHSVRQFCNLAFAALGIELQWEGEGLNEKGFAARVHPSALLRKYVQETAMATLEPRSPVIHVDPKYFRPTEVDTLLGDPAKARKTLGWKSEIPFKTLVAEMVEKDLEDSVRELFTLRNGFDLPASCEALM